MTDAEILPLLQEIDLYAGKWRSRPTPEERATLLRSLRGCLADLAGLDPEGEDPVARRAAELVRVVVRSLVEQEFQDRLEEARDYAGFLRLAARLEARAAADIEES